MEKIPAPAAMLKSSYPGPITFYNGVRLGSRELLLLAQGTPRQNVYACARMNISGLFFSHTFQSDQSLPRAFGFILCAACGSVLLLHAARVLTIL